MSIEKINNKRLFPVILFVSILFCACGGSGRSQQEPVFVQSGMKEIQKGAVWYKKGCYERALEHFFKAHELFSASDQLNGVAMSLNNIGNIYRITNDADRAIKIFEESFSIYTQINDSDGAMRALSNKAAALTDAGMFEEAHKVLAMADGLARKNKSVFVPILKNKGILFIKTKDFASAGDVLEKAVENTDSENLSEFAAVNFAYGSLMLKTQQYDRAIEFFYKALSADRQAGFHKGLADDLASIGSAYFSQEKYDQSINFFKRSIKIYALSGDREKAVKIQEQMDNASKEAGIDTGITRHFVQKWLEGDIIQAPCD